MSNGTHKKTDLTKPGLALSGGGYRATLFHIGALIRLNEWGLLPTIERVSAVSGGAIAAGALAHAWPTFAWRDGVATDFGVRFVKPLRTFCKRTIDEKSVFWGALLPGKTIGDVLADIYDEHLGFAGKKLADLSAGPQFVFNATNLQTGRRVHIEKRRLSDYTIGILPDPDVRLAVAVAASSAFPPVLSPVTIKTDPKAWTKSPGAIHHGDPAYCRRLELTDGGAYDNLGLETVDGFETVLVSDAGAPFSVEEEASSFWPSQALRALDIATDQARGLRKRLLIAEIRLAKTDPELRPRRAAYAGIDRAPDSFDKVVTTLKADPAKTAPLARIRTRLDRFTDAEQGALINWGYWLMDAAYRRDVDPAREPAPGWPVPAQALG